MSRVAGRGSRRGRTPAPSAAGDPVVQLERRVRALQLLHATATRLSSMRALSELLPEMVEQLRTVLGVEIASIMLLDEARAELKIAAAAGLPPDVIEHARVPVGSGVSGQVAARGEPVLIRDLSQHAEFGRSQHASQYTTESLLCVPLRIGARVLGVVNVNNKTDGHPLDEEDLALVTTFAAQASMAIENARLYAGLESEVRSVTRELRETNEELLRVQELTESILRNMSSGLVVADMAGAIVRVNPSAAGLLGIPADAKGETLVTVFGPDGAEAIAHVTDAGPAERREIAVRARGGSELLLGYSTSALVAHGVRAGTVIIFRDLTRLKAMEAQIVRMDRMASLGVVGAGIAHEIRNPLAAIRFNLDFLREDGEPREELDVITKNVERLDDLVRKLLRFARPQKPAFELQPLAPRVEAVLALIDKQAAASGVVITRDLDQEAPPVLMDGPQAEQVILNVVLNAIQSMPAGGTLRLATRVMTHRLDRREYLELSVSDSGPGLTEEAARQIFDPFFTTRREGTGLGLAVAQRIMEDHGGTIEVGPAPPRGGATFLIGFPIDGMGS